MRLSIFGFLIVLLSLIVCHNRVETDSMIGNTSEVFESVQVLSSTKIFFGHASVGYNIMGGVERICVAPCSLNVLEIRDDRVPVESGFYHKLNGKNFDPKGKCDAFRTFLMEDNRGEKFDIAFFKFCFVDITRDTDIEDVMNYYVQTVDTLKTYFPDLTLVHVTVPLTVHAWGVKGWLKNLLAPDLDNVKRNQFNRLLITTYENHDPIFDLAKIESTTPDNKCSFFKYRGQIFYSLYRYYSNDGGHLNEHASELAAVALLQVLSNAAVSLK